MSTTKKIFLQLKQTYWVKLRQKCARKSAVVSERQKRKKNCLYSEKQNH